mgnify:CR=1 FL=1
MAAVGDGFAGRPFDPEFETGPAPGNRLHLNNVFCAPGGMYISGMRTGGLLLFNGRELRRWVTMPVGAHNARPFRDGVLFNDTEADVVRFATRTTERAFPVPRYPPEQLYARRSERYRASRARPSDAGCA